MKWNEVGTIYRSRTNFISCFKVDASFSGQRSYTARNFRNGKIPFTVRMAGVPATSLNIGLLLANLSYAEIITQIRERFADQLARYEIKIHD